MRSQCILVHQLFGNLASKAKLYTARSINPRKLLFLRLRILQELALLTFKIGVLGIGLGTDRNIFSRRHGHGTGNKPSDSGKQNI